MRYFTSTCLLFLLTFAVSAQNFNEYFIDKSLRLDYTFIGNYNTEIVALDQLHRLESWAGRRNNLTELARLGNGQIIVTDSQTGDIIYKEAFSSLFQEWVSTPEAKNEFRSFENTYLIPFPKKEVTIEVLFRNKEGAYQSMLKHNVDPKDILIRKKAQNNAPSYVKIHEGNEISKAINVAIIPEGYTAEEMPKFKEHARIAVEEIFKHKPFNKYKNRINFFAVEAPSKESNVSIPRKEIWRETAVSSHFDTFYSDRYLTTSNVRDLHNLLIATPYNHIIVLANTETYGGGGILNSYTLTTTGHCDFAPVVVHEFGHSFAGLADEYYYDSGDVLDNTYSTKVEPWEPNISTLVDFNSKWKDLLPENISIPTNSKDSNKYPIGVYEGAGYSAKNIYRAALDCRMKTNTAKEFCPVCQRAIEQIIKYYTE